MERFQTLGMIFSLNILWLIQGREFIIQRKSNFIQRNAQKYPKLPKSLEEVNVALDDNFILKKALMWCLCFSKKCINLLIQCLWSSAILPILYINYLPHCKLFIRPIVFFFLRPIIYESVPMYISVFKARFMKILLNTM